MDRLDVGNLSGTDYPCNIKITFRTIGRPNTDRLIGELIKTQGPDGYAGIFRPEYRIATLWDLHEMVYLIHGLLADHQCFGNAASLAAARRLGDYIIARRRPTDKTRRIDYD